MKLHDLQPGRGSRQPRTRVGRGIAAGKGKTAGRGTKGQKARAGGSIPPWFEGGQTPLHMRIPKLRGFKNRFKIEYEVVNVGAIGALAERGAFELDGAGRGRRRKAGADHGQPGDPARRRAWCGRSTSRSRSSAPASCRRRSSWSPTRSRRPPGAKIEAAGGSVNVLEIPTAAARRARRRARRAGPRASRARPPAGPRPRRPVPGRPRGRRRRDRGRGDRRGRPGRQGSTKAPAKAETKAPRQGRQGAEAEAEEPQRDPGRSDGRRRRRAEAPAHGEPTPQRRVDESAEADTPSGDDA